MSLLSLVMLTALTLAVPATVAVFTVRGTRAAGSAHRWERALIATVTVGLGALVAAALLGATPGRATMVALILSLSVLAWSWLSRDWAARGIVAWALTLDAGLAYLAYILWWTLTAGLSTSAEVASTALWLLESFVFVLGVGYLWEFTDVLARRHWRASIDPRALPEEQRRHRPFVSIHVPTHNEPPDLVIGTLRTLLELDYPVYEIVVLDNNTDDEALWRPLQVFCEGHDRITFVHLEDWPGFKSGALNYGLTVTDPRAEVIGIVDADYLVEPDWLSDCAPLFADPAVAFVQTPQDYREWEEVPYFRRLYYSYGYFFDVSQRSRNEHNGAIFGGTMGLIRREALSEVGGWDEWCITEDAELSLRLLRAGGLGLHVDRSYGRGVMPLTFESLKSQRFRWCFGGIQILRMHWKSLLPGRRTAANQLSLRQRWAYLAGGLQWFSDAAATAFTGFLALGAVDLVWGTGLVVRRLSGLLVLGVLALVLLGMMRALALVRRTSGASWGEAVGAFGLWLALGLTVAHASVRGLFARQGVFLRTPKVRGELKASYAVRGNPLEILLSVGSLTVAGAVATVGTLGSTLIAVLLGVQGVGYAAAPLNSLAAIRSDLPAELRRRRRLMAAPWAAPARRGGILLVGIGAALIAGVLFAAPVAAPDLRGITRQAAEPGKAAPSPEGSDRSPSSGRSTASASASPLALSIAPPSTAASTVPPVGATSPPLPSPSATSTQGPTATPTRGPTATPTRKPTTSPTRKPTTAPTRKPTTSPTRKPTTSPTRKPTTSPTRKPAHTANPTPTHP